MRTLHKNILFIFCNRTKWTRKSQVRFKFLKKKVTLQRVGGWRGGEFTQKGNVYQKGLSIDGCFGHGMRCAKNLMKIGLMRLIDHVYTNYINMQSTFWKTVQNVFNGSWGSWSRLWVLIDLESSHDSPSPSGAVQ